VPTSTPTSMVSALLPEAISTASEPFAGIPNQSGQVEVRNSRIDYGLLLALLAVVCIVGLTALGERFRHRGDESDPPTTGFGGRGSSPGAGVEASLGPEQPGPASVDQNPGPVGKDPGPVGKDPGPIN
jgi:hypothetical protein